MINRMNRVNGRLEEDTSPLASAVRYDADQIRSEEEKAQARANMGAISEAQLADTKADLEEQIENISGISDPEAVSQMVEDVAKHETDISALKSNFEPYSSEVFYRGLFDQKGLGLSVGNVVAVLDSTIRLSIPNLQHAKAPITITVDSGYRFGVATCDANNILLSDSGWQTGEVTIPTGTYYHVTLSKTNNGEIPLTDVSHIYIKEEDFSGVDVMTEQLESQIASLILTADNLAIIRNYDLGYLSNTGVMTTPSTSNERTTDYIDLDGNSGITVQEWGTPVNNGIWMSVCFYTESKEFIRRDTYILAGVTHVSNYFPAPSNAVYVRVSFRQGNDILLMVNYGKNAPSYSMAKEDIYYLNHPTDVTPRAFIKSINHRGYNSIAPENTLPAYKLSKLYGFEYAETDIEFTSDGVAVLLHDSTIDRTSNGTGNIASMTYSQVSQYDFGSWKSADYAGTKIPTFVEFITLCKKIGLKPYIELKTGTQAQIEDLVTTVKSYGMSNNVTWVSFQSDMLSYVIGKDDTARVGYMPAYGTDIVDSDITKAQALATGHNDVFISVQMSALTSTGVSKAVTAGIPVEVYDGNATNIKTMNPYITGVTADVVVTDLILYKDAMQ